MHSTAVPGYWQWHVWKRNCARNTGSPKGRGFGKPQRDIGDDQARPLGMAEWLVVLRKSGNADGGKGPQFKTNVDK
jgi:hypothetical protein